MTDRSRICNNCEYHKHNQQYNRHHCCYNPPTVVPAGPSGVRTSRPSIEITDFCSKWEPVWGDNPKIKEQWGKFKTSLALQMK